ncbi:MAG: hypothetical protein JSR39_02225 [Verrucomicrobia bacterium]|nr:hypothetical protein [Verrucomicrobiota bacterium]
MATQINMQETAPAPTNFPCGGVGGSNLGSITPALLEIASTMMELNNSYNQIAMDSTNLQGLFNNEQTKETREEGKKGAAACYAQAAGSFASAGCDAISTGVSYGATKGLNNQLTQESDELDQLNSFQGKVQDQMTMKGRDIEMQELDGQGNPLRSGNVDGRIQEMQAGRISQSNINYVQNNGEASLDDQALSGASSKELDQIKGQTDDQVKNKTQSINTLQNQIQSKENQIRMGFDMLKQGLNGGSQVAQGIFNDQKSQAQATGLSAQFDQQIQTTAAQTDQKMVADGEQQVLSVFQALAQAGQAMV